MRIVFFSGLTGYFGLWDPTKQYEESLSTIEGKKKLCTFDQSFVANHYVWENGLKRFPIIRQMKNNRLIKQNTIYGKPEKTTGF